MPIGHLYICFGKHIYSGLCLFLNKLSFFFLILSFMSSLYILDINLLLNIMHACVLSHVQLFATLWTIAHQAPLSMEFSRQEYWSGLPFPPLGYFPNPGKILCLESLALVGGFFTAATWECPLLDISFVNIFSQSECLQIRAIFSFPIFLIF